MPGSVLGQTIPDAGSLPSDRSRATLFMPMPAEIASSDDRSGPGHGSVTQRRETTGSSPSHSPGRPLVAKDSRRLPVGWSHRSTRGLGAGATPKGIVSVDDYPRVNAAARLADAGLLDHRVSVRRTSSNSGSPSNQGWRRWQSRRRHYFDPLGHTGSDTEPGDLVGSRCRETASGLDSFACRGNCPPFLRPIPNPVTRQPPIDLFVCVCVCVCVAWVHRVSRGRTCLLAREGPGGDCGTDPAGAVRGALRCFGELLGRTGRPTRLGTARAWKRTTSEQTRASLHEKPAAAAASSSR